MVSGMTWLLLNFTAEPRENHASEKQTFYPASRCLCDASPVQRTEQWVQRLHAKVAFHWECLDLVQATGRGPSDTQKHGRTSLKAVRKKVKVAK